MGAIGTAYDEAKEERRQNRRQAKGRRVGVQQHAAADDADREQRPAGARDHRVQAQCGCRQRAEQE